RSACAWRGGSLPLSGGAYRFDREAWSEVPSGRPTRASMSLGSKEKLSLDMPFLLGCVRRHRQFDLSDVELLVEMGKLAPGVFEKKLALEKECGSEDVQEQHRRAGQKDGPVFMKEHPLVGGQELQLVHEPEAVSEKQSDGEEECVRDHGLSHASEV